MTKLTDKKIKFICKHRVDIRDWKNQQLAIQFEVTERRVQQLVKEYKETGKYPKLNPSRRPKGSPLTEQEKQIIETTWEEKRLGARLLFYEIQKRGYKIPHHKINKYLQDFKNISFNKTLNLFHPEDLIRKQMVN